MSTRESRVVVHGSHRRKRRSKLKEPPNMSDLRVVLLGKSVSENSEVGNFILGRAAFDSEAPPGVAERIGGRLKNRHVMIINSPQLLQTHLSLRQIIKTARECVYLSDPGPHVIVLLLKHDQCSAEDQECVEKVLDSFSEQVYQHTMVFTTQEPTQTNDILQKIIQKCCNRHFSLQGNSSPDDLLQAFEDIVQMNDGRHLDCAEASQGFSMKHQDKRLSEGEKLNLVVCGSYGTLKSSISELILKQKDRRSDVDLYGRVISVMELPALIHLSEEEVMRQTLRCVSLCHPGVHVFLLIIPDSLNNEDKAEMEEIQRIFSSRINKHMMILIMQNSEHQTEELDEETQSVIERFGGRHHFFGPSTRVSTLMEKVKKILEEIRGEFFSTETFLEAQMKKLLKFEEMKKKIHKLETYLESQGSRENPDELRIVLLGKTGVGKSAAGNTILGIKAFTAEASHRSVTKESQRETSDINGRHVTVIDTPGLFDTELTNEEIQREIRHCISMILPGPHVFIIVLNLGQRFTREEATSVKIIQETFGEKSLMFTMVLFTRGDDLKDKTIEQYLEEPGSPLMNLIEACGNRYHVFNNNQTGDRTQVSDLLEKIDHMVNANGGSFYSCKMFRQMEREQQEQQMKILMDRVRETEEEKERMKMMMEEERQNHDEERKRREEELKREMKEQEEHQREIRDEMRRERETFKHEIEDIRREKEKIKTEKDQLQMEIDKLMNRIDNGRQNHETERKRREEEFNEREDQYKRELKEKEKLMKKYEGEKERMMMMMVEERQSHDIERKRREEELKREIREQEEHQREKRDEMRRERETFKHEIEEIRREKENVKKEKENLQIRYDTGIDRLMNRIENERQSHEKERKRREEEFNARVEHYKTLIKEKEESEEKMRKEMKRERETFKHEIEETRREKEKIKTEKEKVKTEFEMKRTLWEESKQKKEDEKRYQHKFYLHKKPASPARDLTKNCGTEMEGANMMPNEHLNLVGLGKTGDGESASGKTILGRQAFTLQRSSMRKTPDNFYPVTPVSSLSSRRIVLLGSGRVGKSAAGNTILGKREFRSESKSYSITSKCSVAHATVSGRSVSVVDTPGFFHSNLKPEEIEKEIKRRIYLSSPGPHAFLIVFPVSSCNFLLIPQMIEMMFGEEVLKYSIILFTHGDHLEDGESVEKLIQGNSRLRDLVGHCGGRYHVFNNRDLNNRDQVNDLLEKIDTMIEQNGGGYYSNQMFEDAQRCRREEEERENNKRRNKDEMF